MFHCDSKKLCRTFAICQNPGLGFGNGQADHKAARCALRNPGLDQFNRTLMIGVRYAQYRLHMFGLLRVTSQIGYEFRNPVGIDRLT